MVLIDLNRFSLVLGSSTGFLTVFVGFEWFVWISDSFGWFRVVPLDF